MTLEQKLRSYGFEYRNTSRGWLHSNGTFLEVVDMFGMYHHQVVVYVYGVRAFFGVRTDHFDLYLSALSDPCKLPLCIGTDLDVIAGAWLKELV